VKSANVSVRQDAAGFGDFDRVFDVLEAAVATGPWLLGERFSAADVMIGLDLHFGIDIFKLVPSRPALRGYVDRCLVRPALQRAKSMISCGARIDMAATSATIRFTLACRAAMAARD